MIIPEICYQLTDFDLSGQLAEFVRIQLDSSAAAVSVSNSGFYTVPAGKLLVIQSLSGYLEPGAAQTGLSVAVTAVAGAQVHEIHGQTFVNVIATQRCYFALKAHMIFPMGFSFSQNGRFNAGVNPNTVRVAMTGWLIPRGSVVI